MDPCGIVLNLSRNYVESLKVNEISSVMVGSKDFITIDTDNENQNNDNSISSDVGWLMTLLKSNYILVTNKYWLWDYIW